MSLPIVLREVFTAEAAPTPKLFNWDRVISVTPGGHPLHRNGANASVEVDEGVAGNRRRYVTETMEEIEAIVMDKLRSVHASGPK